MADQSLRELLRRWQASGAPSDAAAWLGARLRAGELPPARLQAAALLGSPGARRLLGPEAPRPPRDLEEWFAAACQLEPALGLRAVIAALRRALPLFEARPERCERHGALRCQQGPCRVDLRPRQALELVEQDELAGAPGGALRGAIEACRDCQRGLELEPVAPPRPVGLRRQEEAVTYGETSRKRRYPAAVIQAACALVAQRGSDAQRDAAVGLLEGVALAPLLRAEGGAALGPRDPAWAGAWEQARAALEAQAFADVLPLVRASAREDAAARGIDRDYALQEALEDLRAAVKAEVVPWLLDSADPLAERLARRPAPRVP